MTEEFKRIKEHPNYLVSNLGNVYNTKKKIDCKKYDNGQGYLSVSIDNKIRYVHRLLAQTFIENIENKKEVNHINGIKSDNVLENLEWCTRGENQKHKFRVLGVINNCGMRGRRNELCVTSKPIVQTSLDGFIINVFPSGIEAQRQLNIDRRNLSKCIKTGKKYRGCLWL